MKARLETQWIVGFVDGEGWFHVERSEHKEKQYLPSFHLFQHKRDIQILYRVKKFFQCGVVRHLKNNIWWYRVQDQKHLRNILVPFFETHPLKTKKQLDFLKFRQILLLMESKEHRNKKGFEKIQKIKKTMYRESPD